MTLTRRGLTTLGAAAMAAAAFPSGAHAQGPSPVVRTVHGPVVGRRDSDIAVFKGLRYGDDTGYRRFLPPQPPRPWSEPAEAFDYGAACPQRGNEPNQSEDCLFLNVWTPGADEARRPVMVYIHGGGYSGGSGSHPLYDGTRLALRGDVVVVTVNHRLNIFGYGPFARVAGEGFEDSGNLGQLDLILALEWVRDNIAAFGGDPDRVMLFGQSGGGAKIATLMAMPKAAGLFHAAATMSGQQVTGCGPLNGTARAMAMLERAGLTPETAHRLRDMPIEALLDASAAEDPILGYGGINFAPLLDGRSLPNHPFFPTAPAQSAHIPMMIGNTREETLAFMGNDPANANLTWETLPARLSPDVMRIDIAPEMVIEGYRRMKPDWTPDQVLIGATTAGRSWRAAVIEAEERARQGSPAYVYQLDFAGTVASGRRGAFHTADIPLVFDNVTIPESRVNEPGAQGVADAMADAFIALARSGNPNHPGLPEWTPYGLENRETMIFDVESRMENDPRGDERAFFARIPYIQPGT